MDLSFNIRLLPMKTLSWSIYGLNCEHPNTPYEDIRLEFIMAKDSISDEF